MTVLVLLSNVVLARSPANIISATTRDYNSNGILDALEVAFDSAIDFPSDGSAHVTIWYITPRIERIEFTIDSIRAISGTPDSQYVFCLTEHADTVPQTGWTPQLSVSDVTEVEPVAVFQASDGAGPVIWKITKMVNEISDRTKDKVTVEFSEQIRADGGMPLPFTASPQDLFNTWLVIGVDTVLIDSMFSGIANLAQTTGDSVVFFMTNENDLNGFHSVSIHTQPSSLIEDTSGNAPLVNNRKVGVTVTGKILGNVKSGPVRMIPLYYYDTTGGAYPHTADALYQTDPQMAFQWARNEGGMLFTSEMVLPSMANLRITGYLLILDARGDTIYFRDQNTDLVPSEWLAESIPGEMRMLVFYWNGITDKGAVADSGLYRSIVSLVCQSTGDTVTDTANILIANYPRCAGIYSEDCWKHDSFAINPVGIQLSTSDNSKTI